MFWASSVSGGTETWPALYDVHDVASDDELNIRESPNAASEIIGTLHHDAANIEVVEVGESRDWGLVNTNERSGWVALRFMERHVQWAQTTPPITACFGAEPFWDLSHTAAETTLSFFGEPLEIQTEAVELISSNRLDRFAMIIGQSSAIISNASCSDGMSDRAYGLSIDVLTKVDGNPVLLSGCCTIAPD